MKWILVLLALALIAGAGYGAVASVDLLTTEIGVLYATCATVAAAAGLIMLAIAALAFRVDSLRSEILRQSESARRVAEVALAPPVTLAPEPRHPAPAPEPPPLADEAPPMAAEIDPVEEGPVQPTTLVGRYSAGGANYSIFSDGSIEAETDQGAFHFASMNEFKAYIAARRA